MLTTPVVAIIIVSYNTKDLTLLCLSSIFSAKKSTDIFEVLVVDNASTDGTVPLILEKFPQVRLIQNRKNIGFAAANNMAIKVSNAPNILLLNSDAQVNKETISVILKYISHHPEVGVVTCKLILSDNTIDLACHRGFPTPWASLTYLLGLEKIFPNSKLFGEYHQGYKNMETIHEIDCPSGAFFFTRRDVVNKVGLLDEAFFMYGEDIDWAYRIKKAGYSIVYNPIVSTLHIKKQSGRSQENSIVKKQTQKYFYQTMAMFYEKHYVSKYPYVVSMLIKNVIQLRLLFLEIFNI